MRIRLPPLLPWRSNKFVSLIFIPFSLMKRLGYHTVCQLSNMVMPSEKYENSKTLLVLKNFKNNSTMDERAVVPQNNSSAELVRNEDGSNDDNNCGRLNSGSERTLKDIKLKEWIIVFILCFVNLINYMDRFTIAGILKDIQSYFEIADDKGGLLQTAFVLSYMIFAPIFGYLGDRYSRKHIMAAGVFLWSLTTLLGSFMNNYWWFLLFRGLVGIGEASYSTIAPTIISDLFVGDIRSKMLALFYFAIPVGSGLGYIVGAETAKAAGSWHWALRVTPALGLIAVLLIFFVLQDPERGESEGSGHMQPTPWTEDITDLVKNRSFLFSTAGFTCVAFVAGALSWWGPKFIEMGLKLQPGGGTVDSDSVAFKFGSVSMIAGLLGVPTGSFVAQRLRENYPRIDAHICAIGLLMSTPMVFFSFLAASYNETLCFFCIFFGEFFFNLTWSIVADILLSFLMGYFGCCFSSSFIFGAITMLAGLVGLTLGCYLSQKLKLIYPRVDPMICAAGLVISAPLLLGATFATTYNTPLCYILLFLGQVALNLNWAIVSDILLYVVLPMRRSTAEGLQLLVSHALGDAGSPYLIGVLSEAFQVLLKDPSSSTNDWSKFRALQYALFSTCFVEILGGVFFLFNALYIIQDKQKVEKVVHERAEQSSVRQDSITPDATHIQ